jgi:hypothetical protein
MNAKVLNAWISTHNRDGPGPYPHRDAHVGAWPGFAAVERGGRQLAPPAAGWLLPLVVVDRLLVEVQLIGVMVQLLFGLVEGIEVSESRSRRSEIDVA